MLAGAMAVMLLHPPGAIGPLPKIELKPRSSATGKPNTKSKMRRGRPLRGRTRRHRK